MLSKLQHILKKYEEIEQKMLQPEIASDIKKSIALSKEMNNIKEAYLLAKAYNKFHHQLEEAKELIWEEDDEEMVDMAKEQKKNAENSIERLEGELKLALLPKDPNDDKNIYLEIRPAAWWDEAWLFAAELLRMYLAYATERWRKPEIVEEQLSDIGWVKFVMVKISGEKVYSLMKFESWVHRVQRIPDTESQWRVHTSTVTVAIMPEVKDVEVELDEKDIQMETYAASSSGWQNANKNQTWVRIHHKPTGIIVNIWDSKSQLKNKEKAFTILKAKLYQAELDKQQKEQKDIRWNQIWTGDRSEKIRTYNYPQDRVTDHRIKKSRSNLPGILAGELDSILKTMVIENQAKQLELAWTE